jgi:hypothetical protein
LAIKHSEETLKKIENSEENLSMEESSEIYDEEEILDLI